MADSLRRTVNGRIANFFPFIATARSYSRDAFKRDLIAAATVAVIALPQSMAYAIIAGVHPKYGLYAAIVPVIVASLFGSSRHLIAGPTNAIAMLVASMLATVSVHGARLADLPADERAGIVFLVAALAGLIQFGMGLARLGALLNFVSHSVIVGFSAGAGLLIAANQLKNLLGLTFPATADLIHTLRAVGEHLGSTNPFAFMIGIGTIVFVAMLRRVFPKFPAPLVAVVIAAVAAASFSLDRFGLALVGAIPASLPPLSSFPVDFDLVRSLFASALAIAFLGIVEALSIARSIAQKSGDRIDANQEFIAQGLGNIAAGFFSAIPGTGSFTRSAVNHAARAKTRFAGVMSGLIVLLAVVALSAYARFIPIASLAGLLMVISLGMINLPAIRFALKATKADRIVLISTFVSTLLLELEMAVAIGVILSIILFLRKVSHPNVFPVIPRPTDAKLVPYHRGMKRCPQIAIYQIDGALFFGAIAELEERLDQIKDDTDCVLIIRMKSVRLIDATGAHALVGFLDECARIGRKVILSGVNPNALIVFKRLGLIDKIGKKNFVTDSTTALHTAITEYVDKDRCRTCSIRVFSECTDAPGAAPTA